MKQNALLRRLVATSSTLLVSLMVGLTGNVLAQSSAVGFPNKSLKFVVPFPAGSATDTAARVMAQAMSAELGQTIAVENKPGANGILGAEQVKVSANDGYTLLVTTNTTQAANVSLYKKLSYDPVKDFTPIAKIGVTGFILMVQPNFPANNIREFIAYAKANPGKLAYGQGSSGSHVSGALFAAMSGIEVTQVAYKGIPPALTDLMGGSLQFAFADVGNAVTQMNGGKLKGLGVTLSKRASRAPNVPTIAEAGVPGYDLAAWFGLMAPANIPREAQQRLTAAALASLNKADVRERLAAAGIDPDPLDNQALARLIDAEIKAWAKYVSAAGIIAE